MFAVIPGIHRIVIAEEIAAIGRPRIVAGIVERSKISIRAIDASSTTASSDLYTRNHNNFSHEQNATYFDFDNPLCAIFSLNL